MLKDMTTQVHAAIDGRTLSELELLRWELDRSRHAHLLLKTLIGHERMIELLADETAKSAALLTGWAEASDGKFTPSTAEITVDGGTAEGFLAWFTHITEQSDDVHLLGAMPEHYLVVPTKTGQSVIETFGGWGRPVKLAIEFSKTVPDMIDPSAVDEAYPLRMIGLGYVGDHVCIGVVLHQFANTDTGFKAKLSIHYPAASDPAMIAGHQRHLACEFTNWTNMYLQSEGLREQD